jgi:hypothetical protein
LSVALKPKTLIISGARLGVAAEGCRRIRTHA